MSDALAFTLQLIKTPSGGNSYDALGGELTANLSVDEMLDKMTVDAATAPGYTVETGFLTTGSYFIVENKDTAIDVTVTWTDSDANANDQRVGPGTFIVIPDFDPSADIVLVSDSGTPKCLVSFGGT